MTEREHDGAEHARDVLDNPEWSEDDVRAGGSLTDFAPEMAEAIARTLGRPVRRAAPRPDVDRTPALQDVPSS